MPEKPPASAGGVVTFSLNLLTIALELAGHNPVYEDVATKFFEHFLYIAGALNNLGQEEIALWDEDDEFFYDVLHLPDDTHLPLRVRSLVGLMPLLAVEGGHHLLQGHHRWLDLVLFHEYFHGETGAGLGASHQTGWTGLVAKLIQQRSEKQEREKHPQE